MSMMDEAKAALASGQWTLVVAKGGELRCFTQRGVADLVTLLEQEPALLRGACVADKIIGKGAAALMILGGVAQVYTPKLTRDALAMLRAAGVQAEYGALIAQVDNRTGTGRCPIDTLCAPLSEPAEMKAAICRFMKRR